MMIQIVPTKNKKGYSKVYTDDIFIGTVPDKLIHKLDQSDDDFVDNVKEWVFNNGKKKLLDYLAKAEHTESDCVNLLKRVGVAPNFFSPLMEHAKTNKWVSDERYARLYCENALLCSMSPLDVKHKLLQKKIKTSIIEKVINEIFCDNAVHELLDNLIEKYVKKYDDLIGNKKFEKIATALYRKGFQYDEYEEKVKLALQIIK